MFTANADIKFYYFYYLQILFFVTNPAHVLQGYILLSIIIFLQCSVLVFPQEQEMSWMKDSLPCRFKKYLMSPNIYIFNIYIFFNI